MTDDVPDHGAGLVGAQLRDVVMSAGVPMGIADAASGRLTLVNAAFADWIGYSEQQLLDMSFAQVFHPDDLPDVLVGTEALVRGTVPTISMTKRYVTSTGQVVWGDLTVSALRGLDGVVELIFGQVVDVTARVEALEAVAESEGRYRFLAENAMDVVLRNGPDGRCAWVSRSVTALLGWRPEELVGRSGAEVWHPDDAERLGSTTARTQPFEKLHAECRALCADGSYRWVSVIAHCVTDAGGSVTDEVMSLRDFEVEHRLRDELATSAARYRLLVENASDVVFHTVDGVVEWISRNVATLLGWSPEELMGRTTAHLWHPDDREAAIALREAAYAGGKDRQVLRFAAKDGTYPWMEIAVRPIAEPDGRVGAVGLMHDVTERVKAERDLLDSEARFRLLAENAMDVVMRNSPDRHCTWVSNSVTGLLGWRPEELIGRAPAEFWHPDDVGRMAAAGMQAKPFERVRTESRALCADGTYRWVSVLGHYVTDDQGNITDGVLSLRDISAERQLREELEQREAQYRLLAENSSDVVMRFNTDVVIEWVFGSTEEITGWRPEQLVGMSGYDLFIQNAEEDVARNLATLSSGGVVAGPIRVRCADGDSHWVNRRSRTVTDDSGTPLSYVTSWRDAQSEVELVDALLESERRARDLADRYEAARNEALEANLAKTAFLSGMSHELRTPLNAVLGFSQLLEMDPLTEDQRESVDQIRRGGRHLLDLISEILDISRIEAGRLSLSLESVEVGEAVAEALDLVRPSALASGIILRGPALPATGVTVWADRQRVIQILLNLLSNAIKYTGAGGSVAVAASEDDSGEIVVSVADTGVGISKDNQRRLFKAFDRLGAESTNVEGTGIGLVLSQGLARVMRGRIDVASVPGEGSVFRLVLPAGRDRPAAPRQPASVGLMSSPGTPVRILYVEDNPANARLMSRIIDLRSNASLRLADTGAEGIRMALGDPPDLVFLDLHLPDLPGEEVLRRLRREPLTAQATIVVLTADASVETRHRVEELGANGFLTKPVEVLDVLGWVDRPRREDDGS